MARLLMQQHTAFSEAYKVLQDHMEESVITEGVLRDCPAYYGKVFQQTRQTRQDIQSLEKRKSMEEALRSTIENQIVLETNKLQKLQRQAHQWMEQAILSLNKLDIIYPQMKLIFETAEEKHQFLGPDMERIADLSIQEKMLTLSSLTTLTIDIQKVLQSWTEFQHQLAVTTEAIVKVCVHKRPTIRFHSP